jgi:FixJ family two-component response regulator
VIAAHAPVVYIVDDDATLRDSLQVLLESVGLRTLVFTDTEGFIKAYRPDTPGCLLLEVRIPGRNDLNAHQQLRNQGIDIAVVIITGHGNVAMAVAAMKQGALDFIEKPFNDQLLLDCVHNALSHDRARCLTHARRQDLLRRLGTLTPREQDVLRQVADGLSNQEIAATLQLSRKTVEVHRAKVMQKMCATNLSELIRMAITIDIIEIFKDNPSAPATRSTAPQYSPSSCASF